MPSPHIPARDPRLPPLHPGEILRRLYIEDGSCSLSAFARALGVSKQRLQPVLAGKSSITADMALRLGHVLGNGPDIWLSMQRAYDLWHAKRTVDTNRLKRLGPSA